jgi:nucleoid DNA-binding protein
MANYPPSRGVVPPAPRYDEHMHKEELIKYLAKKNRRSQHHYRTALTEILDGMKEKLVDGKEVRLFGFGTFYTKMQQAGKGRNFKTGKPMEYKPVRRVGFHAGDLLRKAVRRRKGLFSR